MYNFLDEDSFKILVIGIGNEFRSDDGIGLYVARRIKNLNLLNVKVIEKSGEGAELIDLWKDENNVIVVDATSSGSQPGTISRFNALENKIPSNFLHCSSHEFSIAEATELARTIKQLPKRLIIYGIEGKDFSQGFELTPEVRKGGDYVVDFILEEINSYQINLSSALELKS